jgi:hypothetical protein
MAEENNKTKDIKAEDDVINWKIPEYQGEKKTKKWYIIAAIIALALLTFAIFSQNLIFAIIIIFSAVLLVVFDGNKPSSLKVEISDKGILVGKEFYEYDQIDNFFIIYKPEENTKNLYLEFKRFARPSLPSNEPAHYEWLLLMINFARTRLSLPLLDMNPIIIRRNLLKYIKENPDKTNIPLSEQLTNLFNL